MLVYTCTYRLTKPPNYQLSSDADQNVLHPFQKYQYSAEINGVGTQRANALNIQIFYSYISNSRQNKLQLNQR